MSSRALIAASLVLFPFSFAAAQTADLSIKPGDQVVRVEVKTAAQLQRLLDLDIDIWSHEYGVGPIDLHVSPAQRKALRADGLGYRVLNADLFKTREQEKAVYQQHLARATRGLATPFDSYLPLADIYTFIDDLAAARPDLCEIIDIGNSIEGRPIKVLHVTGPAAGPKPGVFYHGLQHCREWITGPVVLYLADQLVNNYDTDGCLRNLVDTTDFYLAPCVNPDGYEYTWTTQRLWRKNRRLNGNGTYGVDLNRNWGYQWGYDNGGSSGTPSSEIYRGTAPFSEPETLALSNFINGHTNIRAYMDYHSYSELLMWAYGYANVLPPEPDRTTFSLVGNQMQQLIQAVHGVNYIAGPIYSTIYPANGTSVDWVYGAAGRFAYTIELRDTGTYGFELPADQILPTCEENFAGILYLSRWASQGLLMEINGAAPPYLLSDQPTTFTLQIVDAQETYVPGSAQGHYRFSGSDPFTDVPATPLGGGLYSVSIPQYSCGATAEIYFTATGSGGFVATVPCDAPTSSLSLPVYDVNTVFADDIETDLGWTVGDTGDNATTGVWNRMAPEATTAQPGADHTGGAGTICWATDGRAGTSVGTYDVDGGKTTLKTPVLDLSAENDPVLGYWRWYSNTAGAAPNADVFTVDISNNGGANWVNVETVGPTGAGTSGGWFYHEFHVTDFVPLTNQVQLRFVAADLGSGSIIEAAIDDFAIAEIGCACPTMLGDLDGNSVLDGRDVAGFSAAIANSPNYSACGDLASPFTAPLDQADVEALVDLLLSQ